MLILGIETSCDETGLALYDSERGLIDHVLHSQTDIHKDYGGVVPELASRDHIRKISPLTKMILANNQKKLVDLDGIAYTSGPGLMGALLIGATFAKTLALSSPKTFSTSLSSSIKFSLLISWSLKINRSV